MSTEEAQQTIDAKFRVATGLKEPVVVKPVPSGGPLKVTVSDHVKIRWHQRVMKNRTWRDAILGLVLVLEVGNFVRTRRQPFQWQRSHTRNLLYLSAGPDVAFPAELPRESRSDLEIVTCLVNPSARDPLRSLSGRRRSR